MSPLERAAASEKAARELVEECELSCQGDSPDYIPLREALSAPVDDGEQPVALTPIQQEAMKLCEPPFRFESGYVFDAHHKMVSDDGPVLDADKNGCVQRVRGWGRIGGLPNGAALQDAMGQVLAIALNRLYATPRVDAQETERLRAALAELIAMLDSKPPVWSSANLASMAVRDAHLSKWDAAWAEARRVIAATGGKK
jgi:hypothetical protein